jgi:hypothetical protein
VIDRRRTARDHVARVIRKGLKCEIAPLAGEGERGA